MPDHSPLQGPTAEELKNAAKALTQKQRTFAEQYIRLGCKSKAYRESYDVSEGTSSATVARNAARVASNEKVAAYVDLLQLAARSSAILSRREGLELLSVIARSKVRHYLTDTGQIDSDAIAERSDLDLESVKVRETEIGVEREIKMRSPIEAIREIAKIEDWYGEGQKDTRTPVMFKIDIGGASVPKTQCPE